MADFRTPSPDSPLHNQLHCQQQQEANPMPAPPPPTSTAIITSDQPSPPPSCVSNQKRRGRPRGSKNKPKAPIYMAPPPEPTVNFSHIFVPPGGDIVEMLMNFARDRRVGITVLNGSGSVSGFTLPEPPAAPSGVYDLVSLSGTFEESSVAGPWLTVMVSANAGAVLAGAVVSKILAVTGVLVNVVVFKSDSEYRYRLGPEVLVRMDQNGLGNVPSLSGGVGGLGINGAMPLPAARIGVPPRHLNWAPALTAQPLNQCFQFQGFKN